MSINNLSSQEGDVIERWQKVFEQRWSCRMPRDPQAALNFVHMIQAFISTHHKGEVTDESLSTAALVLSNVLPWDKRPVGDPNSKRKAEIARLERQEKAPLFQESNSNPSHSEQQRIREAQVARQTSIVDNPFWQMKNEEARREVAEICSRYRKCTSDGRTAWAKTQERRGELSALKCIHPNKNSKGEFVVDYKATLEAVNQRLSEYSKQDEKSVWA